MRRSSLDPAEQTRRLMARVDRLLLSLPPRSASRAHAIGVRTQVCGVAAALEMEAKATQEPPA